MSFLIIQSDDVFMNVLLRDRKSCNGGGIRWEKLTQWVDLQVCEEQVFIQIEESHDEAGQDPAERFHPSLITYQSIVIQISDIQKSKRDFKMRISSSFHLCKIWLENRFTCIHRSFAIRFSSDRRYKYRSLMCGDESNEKSGCCAFVKWSYLKI